jgi:uncharacterized protein (TIGR03083 family)
MDFLRSIRQDGGLFYTTALVADSSLGVPSTPDWTIADLVWHLGEVHWLWATDIELRASDPEQIEASKPARPTTYADVTAWGRSQLDRMIKLLESTPDDVAVWTWALNESDHTVGFIRRHQVQEVAVHRWDLQSAATNRDPDPIDAEVASDSIDEFLSISLPWGVNDKKPLPGSVHLHCIDVAGEWFISPNGTVERAHAKGDVAVRGTASDLLLALYNRINIDDLDVIGDASLASQLVESVDTT